ncbi:DUF2341 domain-containing protein [Candidatus Bathyarchaeota archaeon A05DMB-2]|nr:DUF2341 domain-containing protein [Candidatus Bathyarchaeota archaeon A05DMB-2]
MTISALLLLSLFLMPIPIAKSEAFLPTIDGNKVYVENADCYISATPHTLTADGYVYLNVTSKTYEGEVDFCLGFKGSLGYPTSLELYDPREEITQHELDLSPYFDDPACQVEYNYTRIAGKTAYDGYVWVYRSTSIVNGKNQTVDSALDRVLLQHYDVADLDARFVYWNTTQTLDWREIGNEAEFEKRNFDFQGMDTWYLSDAAIQKNKNYYLRMWLTIVPNFSNGIHEFFVAFKPCGETLEQSVASGRFCYLDPWYSSSWSYRKSHVIENAAGAGTNYQIRLLVYYGSGSDYGGVVYLGGKCRSDFGDIRFTDNDGNTLLDYWRESYTASSSAVFWIEIKDDLSVTDAIFYIYYGNAGAGTTSNFDATFIFGEPFDSGTLSTSRWPTAYRTGNPTYWIDSTYHFIDIYNMDANNWWNGKGFRSKSFSLPDSWLIESAYGMYQPFWMVHYTEVSSEIFGGLFNVEHSDYSPSDYGVAHLSLRDHWAANKNWLYYAGVGGNVDYDSGEQTFSDYVLKTLKIWKLDGYIRVSVDGTTRVTEYNTETANYVHLGIARYSTYGFGLERFYAFKIRKYVADEPDHGAWGPEQQWSTWPDLDYAIIIWGTQHYPDDLGGNNELTLSSDVSSYIYGLFVNTGRYDKCDNYWGSQTQPENVYNTVYDTERNYDYTTVFYKGHIYPDCGCEVPNCPFTHYGIYDNETDAIKDWSIYENLNRINTGFLFLWACGHGAASLEGGYSGGHSWGMIASWMGTLDLVFDGYANSDASNRCFISFENVSINFIEPTEYDSWNYGHFAFLFYYYALSGGVFSIKNALDLAAEDTHGGNSFGNCQLYTGYERDNPVYDPEHPEWGPPTLWCYMRVWGDTDHVIPS